MQAFRYGMCVLLAVLLVLSKATAQSASISIDTTVRHQTITGWEATGFIGAANSTALPTYRSELLRIAAEDIGITRVRLEIRSGVENSVDHYAVWAERGYPQSDSLYQEWRGSRYATVNDNADSSINWNGFHFTDFDWRIENVLLPLRDAVERAGGKLHVNVCYVAFTGQIRNGVYIHHDPDEYAEFVLATYLHMQRKYGLVPDTWEVLLEPDNVQQWNGTIMGNAMRSAARRLQSWGFKPAFVAPSTTSMANAVTYFDAMTAVPGARDHLVEYSYHRYSGVSRANLDAIAARARQFGLQTSMIEWWFGRATHEILYEDLRYGINSAWQDRTILGMITVDTSNVSQPKLTIDEVTEYNRIYFRSIRPGMTRVETTGETADFRALAFMDPGGRMAVILDSKQQGIVHLKGLKPGTYSVLYSTPGSYFKQGAAIAVSSGGECDVAVFAGVTSLSYSGAPTSLEASTPAAFQVQLSPNPFGSSTMLRVSGPENETRRSRFIIIDVLGRPVFESHDLSVPKLIQRSGLSRGTYRYLVLDGTARCASGILMITD